MKIGEIGKQFNKQFCISMAEITYPVQEEKVPLVNVDLFNIFPRICHVNDRLLLMKLWLQTYAGSLRCVITAISVSLTSGYLIEQKSRTDMIANKSFFFYYRIEEHHVM